MVKSKVKRRKRKNQRQLNRQTLISMATVTFVVLALLLVVSINGISLREKNAEYEKTMQTLNQQIAKEEERAKEIEEYRAYVNSDAYIEKIAKEQLGLVDENEIIFYSGDAANIPPASDKTTDEDSYDEDSYDGDSYDEDSYDEDSYDDDSGDDDYDNESDEEE